MNEGENSCEKTQTTLAEGNPDISKPEVMDEHQQREAKGDDQFPGITPDNTLSFNLNSNSNAFKGSEEQRTNSPTEESKRQSKEIVAKDLTLKNTSSLGSVKFCLQQENLRRNRVLKVEMQRKTLIPLTLLTRTLAST